MRIGIDLISENGRAGGIHTYANRLIEGIVRLLETSPADEHPGLELVVFAHEDYHWSFPVGASGRIRIVGSGRSGLGASSRRLLQQVLVPGLARRERINLLHSVNNVLPLGLRTPAVLTVHDLSAFVLPRRFGALKRGFLRWAVPRSVRAARRVISDSETVRGEILRLVPGAAAARIHAIPLGVDPRFHPRRDPAAERKLRERWGLEGEFLLYVGAVEPGKNLGGITRALEIVERRRRRAVPWALAGARGPHLRDLESAWSRSSAGASIRALGDVPEADLPHLYRMARAFIFPSLYEGFGLPLLEAMACGKPCIASRRMAGGGSALGEIAGEAALLVDPERPEEIAGAIEELWGDEGVRDRLSARAAARAARFTWEETARRTLAVYREAGQEAAIGSLPSKPPAADSQPVIR